MSLQAIINHSGIKADRFEKVHGGDISQAYCIFSKNDKYFLKINSTALYPSMFEKEAAGLWALKSNTDLAVPVVIISGIFDSHQYLLLEWIEKGPEVKNAWNKFGYSLAGLHKQTTSRFGWEEENYIGSIIQLNSWNENWHSFYADCRIRPLVNQLADIGSFNQSDLDSAERFCTKLEGLIPSEPPALLHGDLWSGNFMFTSQGKTSVFDPAIYYGHREIDLAMSRLFGGFHHTFYQAYHEAFPLQPGWEQRIDIFQLYPLLVHARLFGGSYIENCRLIIRKYS